MVPTIDYAKTAHMDAWLRHPVLGDPSFDTFRPEGNVVHRSQPPYTWTVNGSVFRDHDGTWYSYAGLYPPGYGYEEPARFRIYRSRDKGAHWEDLGWGFEEGFCFDGDQDPSDGCPDVVLCYDEKQKKYLLTYDTFTYDRRWLETPNPVSHVISGAALAWADTPAGPFRRLPSRFVTNGEDTVCGRYNRCYASTVLPREKDYIAFILMDSGPHYAWGLAVSTAPAADGPWSKPSIILSCDRPEYYPCPVEFYPAYVQNGTVYCPATSVAMNRNYQAIFAAPLERSHDPEAWSLTANGNVWHANDDPKEHFGIWGQTYHGFVEPETGRFVVLYPSRDTQDYGVLSLASRPWDQPHSDGFTMTAHGGPSISPLLAAYGEFSLEAEFLCKGTVDFAFAYNGILGPNDSISDAIPAPQCLSDYAALRIREDRCAVVYIDPDGSETVLAQAAIDAPVTALKMHWHSGELTVEINGKSVFHRISIPQAAGRIGSPALILGTFSRIECTQFRITGQPRRYCLRYNATDALLGAGQRHPEHPTADPAGALTADIWHRIPGGYVGEGSITAKWNVIGSRFTLCQERSPAYGTAGIWVDGVFQSILDLNGDGTAIFTTRSFEMGPHALRIAPLHGRIAISGLTVEG